MDKNAEHGPSSGSSFHEDGPADSTRKIPEYYYDHNQNEVSSYDVITEMDGDIVSSNILYTYLTGRTPATSTVGPRVQEASYRSLDSFSTIPLGVGSSPGSTNIHSHQDHYNRRKYSTNDASNYSSTYDDGINHGDQYSYGPTSYHEMSRSQVMVYGIKEIPNWCIYYIDQRNRLPDFSGEWKKQLISLLWNRSWFYMFFVCYFP